MRRLRQVSLCVVCKLHISSVWAWHTYLRAVLRAETAFACFPSSYFVILAYIRVLFTCLAFLGCSQHQQYRARLMICVFFCVKAATHGACRCSRLDGPVWATRPDGPQYYHKLPQILPHFDTRYSISESRTTMGQDGSGPEFHVNFGSVGSL